MKHCLFILGLLLLLRNQLCSFDEEAGAVLARACVSGPQFFNGLEKPLHHSFSRRCIAFSTFMGGTKKKYLIYLQKRKDKQDIPPSILAHSLFATVSTLKPCFFSMSLVLQKPSAIMMWSLYLIMFAASSSPSGTKRTV